MSFGADFLETWLSPVGHAADFAQMHALPAGKAGTFVHVEPRLSMTAANADQWLRNAPGTEGLAGPRHAEGDRRRGAGGARRRRAVPSAARCRAIDVAAVATQSGVPADTIKRIAHDLAASKTGLVLGGGAAVIGRNATDMLQAVNLLNVAIGAVGKRVRFGGEIRVRMAAPTPTCSRSPRPWPRARSRC